ncbi:hypothetical protein Hhel01_03556 [Haloferula helveola]
MQPVAIGDVKRGSKVAWEEFLTSVFATPELVP